MQLYRKQTDRLANSPLARLQIVLFGLTLDSGVEQSASREIASSIPVLPERYDRHPECESCH